MTALADLSFHCKDASLREGCRRIVDTIDRDGGSPMSRLMAIGVGRRANVDADAIERRSMHSTS